MSLASNVTDLAQAVGNELKSHKVLINGNATDLSALTVSAANKVNLVAAINEVNASVGSAAGIDDNNTSPSSTWSSQHTSEQIDASKATVEAEIPTLTDLIDDTAPSSTTVYSSAYTDSAISAAVGAIDLTSIIDDITPAADHVYSSSHTDAAISTAVNNLIDSAPDTLNTLGELAAALQGDESGITAIQDALTHRVRVDDAQSFTDTEQGQARTNIGAAAAADLTALSSTVGTFADGDFVDTFTAALAS